MASGDAAAARRRQEVPLQPLPKYEVLSVSLQFLQRWTSVLLGKAFADIVPTHSNYNLDGSLRWFPARYTAFIIDTYDEWRRNDTPLRLHLRAVNADDRHALVFTDHD